MQTRCEHKPLPHRTPASDVTHTRTTFLPYILLALFGWLALAGRILIASACRLQGGSRGRLWLEQTQVVSSELLRSDLEVLERRNTTDDYRYTTSK
jgi:hypothetical protein